MKFSRTTRVLAPVAVAALSLSALAAGPVTSASAAKSAKVPTLSLSQLNRTFSAMGKLKPLVSMGTGPIAEILPDTTTSARYTELTAGSSAHLACDQHG